VSVKDILREIEALPCEQRWSVLEGVRRLVEPEVPASFKEGMEQIKRGEGIDLDDALRELDEA
jgi:hypothetical protein